VKRFIVTLLAMVLTFCAAGYCVAAPAAKEGLPVIRMEQQLQEYRTPQGQVCIVTDYTRLIVENAEAFPALAKKLEAVHNREWALIMKSEAETGYEDAVEMKKYRPEDYMHFLLEERIWQKYLDRNILSLYVEFYQSRGGAHPNLDIRCYNFDPATGNFITLDDVLAANQRQNFLQKAVKPALEKFRKEQGLTFYDNYGNIVADLFARDYAGEPPLSWTWGDEGITMCFPPETIAHRVMGPVEAFVPFKRNEKLFNKKYLK